MKPESTSESTAPLGGEQSTNADTLNDFVDRLDANFSAKFNSLSNDFDGKLNSFLDLLNNDFDKKLALLSDSLSKSFDAKLDELGRDIDSLREDVEDGKRKSRYHTDQISILESRLLGREVVGSSGGPAPVRYESTGTGLIDPKWRWEREHPFRR